MLSRKFNVTTETHTVMSTFGEMTNARVTAYSTTTFTVLSLLVVYDSIPVVSAG